MQPQAKDSILTLENKKRIGLTGVESVDAFSETCIVLTVCGARVKLSGAHLKITAFSQGTGVFSAVGEVSSVVYGAQRGKFLQRLFR